MRTKIILQKNLFKQIIVKCLPILFSFLSFTLFSQIKYDDTIDIANQISENKISIVSSNAFYVGGTKELLDNDSMTIVLAEYYKDVEIVLDFKKQVKSFGSSLLPAFYNYTWTLECADYLADIQNKNGSYTVLTSNASATSNVWSNITFSKSFRFLKITVKPLNGIPFIYLRGWKIFASREETIKDICISPNEIKILPNKSFTPVSYLIDTSNVYHKIKASNLKWEITDTTIVRINGSGQLYAKKQGTTNLTVSYKTLKTNVSITVTNKIITLKAKTRNVKVALVIIDPATSIYNGKTFSQYHGWYDPLKLSKDLCDSLNAASGGVVKYELVQTNYDTNIYCKFGDINIKKDSLAKLFLEPGWVTLKNVTEKLQQTRFLYNDLLNKYDFCTQSNNKQIDEVWVYTMPFLATYESTLTGNGAFWYNSPPLTGNSCTAQLPIMGLNYERGLAEAWHSFGHRTESAIKNLYGRWNQTTKTPNTWELFSKYDTLNPGNSHIGNIHFPPNGTYDYNYENKNYVVNYAENWNSYPFLYDKNKAINCSTWSCTHLGYMSWWFRHLPKATCLDKNGFLNNWWSYIVDFEEAKAEEKKISNCNCTIFPPPCKNSSKNVSISACNNYLSPSKKYTWNKSGTYYDTIDNYSGCDSFLTITLKINKNIDSIQFALKELPDFCPGAAQILEANSKSAVKYTWSTFDTTQSIKVDKSANYAVTVEDNNGCKKTGNYNYVLNKYNLFSAYTILTQRQIDLNNYSNVTTGGVGIIRNSRLTLTFNSRIDGLAAFGKAKIITLSNSSYISEIISNDTVTVNLPKYLSNPYCNNTIKNLIVKSGAHVITKDSIFGNIFMEKNSKITFTSKNIYLKKLTTELKDSILFENCANLLICENAVLGPKTFFNTTGDKMVNLYINKSFDIDYGSVFKGNIYAQNSIVSNGFSANRNSLTGKFIGQDFTSRFTNIEQLKNCNSCSSNPNNPVSSNSSSEYLTASIIPNPSDGNFKINVNSEKSGYLNIKIINLQGASFYENSVNNFYGLRSFEINLTKKIPGLYYVIVQLDDKLLNKTIVIE